MIKFHINLNTNVSLILNKSSCCSENKTEIHIFNNQINKLKVATFMCVVCPSYPILPYSTAARIFIGEAAYAGGW